MTQILEPVKIDLLHNLVEASFGLFRYPRKEAADLTVQT